VLHPLTNPTETHRGTMSEWDQNKPKRPSHAERHNILEDGMMQLDRKDQKSIMEQRRLARIGPHADRRHNPLISKTRNARLSEELPKPKGD